MTTPDEVLAFWLDEVGPEGWYKGEEIDALVRERFLGAWNEVRQGRFGLWLTYPNGTLAYTILTDQLARNLHRGTALAFATDRQARAAAKAAIDRNWDLRIDEPARQFFYMPLMHSECSPDQDRCVRLLKTRMPKTGSGNLLHAKAHREIIRQFGRFPFRNDALSRRTKPVERDFIDNGGYGRIVHQLEALA